MKCLKPDHNTISNFRQDNEKAIRKVFRATIEIAKHFDLIGGKLIAGDSTKLRRIGNILTMNVLKKYLRMLSSLFMCLFDLKWVILKRSRGLCYVSPVRTVEINLRLKPA